MKKLTGKEIALSGVSAALAIVFILGAVYVPNLTLSFYVFSAIAISLPLLKNLIISSILSYVVASIVAFLLVSINAMPFILFFGLYAIISWLLDFKFYKLEYIPKGVRIGLIIFQKIIYFVMVFFGCYFLMELTVADFKLFDTTLSLPVLMLIAFVVFVLYDFLYREAFKMVKRRLENKI